MVDGYQVDLSKKRADLGILVWWQLVEDLRQRTITRSRSDRLGRSSLPKSARQATSTSHIAIAMQRGAGGCRQDMSRA